MATSRVAVLDCGASRTRLAVFSRRRGGRIRLEQLATEILPITGARDDAWTEHTGVAAAKLRAQLKPRGDVVVVLPGHLVLTKFIKTPRVDAAKRAKVIQFEARQNLPFALPDVVWGHAVTGETDVDFDVMLCAAKRDALDALGAALEAAGYSPRSFLPAPLALLAAYRAARPAAAPSTLLVEAGARTTTLLRAEARQVRARTLALGGHSVTQQLAAALGGDFAAAEEAKLSTHPAELVGNASDAFATRLTQEITRTVLHFNRESGAPNPDQLLLAGGSARLAGLAERLSARLHVPVVAFDPLASVETAGAAEAMAGDHAGALGALCGGAALQLHPGGEVVDLLPPRLHSRATTRRRQLWLAAAALVAAGALVAPLLHVRTLEIELHRKLAAVEAEIVPLRRRESANRANLERLAALQREVTALQLVHDRRASWQTLFADLQDRLAKVEDVWLDKLELLPAAPAAAASAEERRAPLRLAFSGRLLDQANPLSKVSDDASRKVRDLLASLRESPFVSAVEGERFDASQPGVLRFDFVLVGQPARPL